METFINAMFWLALALAAVGALCFIARERDWLEPDQYWHLIDAQLFCWVMAVIVLFAFVASSFLLGVKRAFFGD